ncbi:NACHT domain-containing protein [Mycena sanguinolenta]|uniref:NACHT domain-containing protein n=1 Tax=Mycena sanguinolenta TaxID=230812 RepID=A0A8H6XK26_9AGAR|nr:NACHT domain-containing protein [Mycena sanguinolenta]
MSPSSSNHQTVTKHITGSESHNDDAGADELPPPDVDMSGGKLVIDDDLQHQDDRGIGILHHVVALAAIHDSTESYPQPKCHPETRTKMLRDLHEWASDTDPGTRILWLYGPAGAGKFAIMHTLAHDFHDAGSLGGCFFFKRGHATRGNARMLFATIAYQLALSAPSLRAPISQIVQNDPSVVVRSIATQMKALISDPCRTHTPCLSITPPAFGLLSPVAQSHKSARYLTRLCILVTISRSV